jgi:hypothetical protein
MKRCGKCGENKALDEFHLNTDRGKQLWCKPCRSAYDKIRHANNRPRKRQLLKLRRKERLEWLWSLKDKPCVDCGIRFHPIAMEWDHLPQFEKSFSIADNFASFSKERILTEVAKCELVCANCHAVRTFTRRELV